MISTIGQHDMFGRLHSQSESYPDLTPSLTDLDTRHSSINHRIAGKKPFFEVLSSAKSLTPTIRIDYKHPIRRHLEPDLNTNLVSCSSLGLMISLDEYYNGN